MSWSLVAEASGTASGGTSVTVARTLLASAQAGDLLIAHGYVLNRGNNVSNGSWEHPNINADFAWGTFSAASGIAAALGNDPTGNKDSFDFMARSYEVVGGESSAGNFTFDITEAAPDCIQGVRVMLFRSTVSLSSFAAVLNHDVDPNFGVAMDSVSDLSVALSTVITSPTANALVLWSVLGLSENTETAQTITTNPTHGTELSTVELSAGDCQFITSWAEGAAPTTATAQVTTTGTKVGSVGVLHGIDGVAGAAIPSSSPDVSFPYERRQVSAKALPFALDTGLLRDL